MSLPEDDDTQGMPFPRLTLEEWAAAVETLVLFDMYGLDGPDL